MIKRLLGISLTLLVTTSYAANKNEMTDRLLTLNNQIHDINVELLNKKNKSDKLKELITNSDQAILKSNQILSQLKEKRALTHSQIAEINNRLLEINSTIDELNQEIIVYTRNIYQQIQLLNNQETSLLNVNADLAREQKTKYLIAMLQAKKNEYDKLSSKLKQLKAVNLNLLKQIDKIDVNLNQKKQQVTLLNKQKDLIQKQANTINFQIDTSNQKLKNLQQERRKLNQLLVYLNKKSENINKSLPKSPDNNTIASAKNDNYTEPFFSRSLAKPMNTEIICQYGVICNGLKSNGVLYDGSQLHSVFAVSQGEVLYNANLVGYGHVIIIAHGDNYVSVYAGVEPKALAVGSYVKMGQVIATSGNKDNQPMGGVYFELRHLGRPINPGLLVNAN